MDSLIPIHSPHPLPSSDVRRQPPCCRVDLSKRVYQTLSNHARNAAHQNVRCFSFAATPRKSGAEAFRKSSAEALRREAAAGSAKPRFYSLFWRANCGRRPRQRDRRGGIPKGAQPSLASLCLLSAGQKVGARRGLSASKGKSKNLKEEGKEGKKPSSLRQKNQCLRPAECPAGVSASKGESEIFKERERG